MKPWLLEVNHTPSFTADTPMDECIKSCLITDTLILENVMWKTRKMFFFNNFFLDTLKADNN